MPGVLSTLRVIEMAGLGPCPLAGQMLADHGAEVIVVDRKSARADGTDINRRGKKSVAVNLKTDAGLDIVRRMIASSDVLIEGFRPGVMERLGLGPDECHAICPGLIYGRMTGWGQDGPLAQTAGHDLNYLALTGALGAIGEQGKPPVPPLNLIADYGGGTMFLLFGILAALFERSLSGKGQVIDAAMVDGVPAMMGLQHSMLTQDTWTATREDNLLDGGAPFYRCYECADGKYLSIGALEPQFFAELLRLAGLPEEQKSDQNDKTNWASRRDLYAKVFKSKSRDEWAQIFDGTDACVAPVLDWHEVEGHSHNSARGTFTRVGGVMQAVAAPRFSRTRASDPIAPTAPGADTNAILSELGIGSVEQDQLREDGVLT